MEANMPERIGKYEILSELGRGGMGVVYRALDRRMGRQVAIKTVSQDFASDPRQLENFYREAEKTGMLRNTNIVTIHDVGDQDGAPYIVMEYVPGESLDRIIKEKRPLPLIEKLVIVEQLCSALGYAHQHDVIHRDVKPANVIVQPDGVVKLLDFGIARQEKKSDLTQTQQGRIIGTVPYMSPERLKGAALDARSDIFATGVLLFQFLTGELPFDGEDTVVVNRILSENRPPLGNWLAEYPPSLDPILDNALAKELADRYSTAEEMGADLFTVIDSLKREHIALLIEDVKILVADQQFVRARDTLQMAQKLDPQHTEVRAMLAEVQGSLGRKQREEQAQQLVAQAADQIREKNFERAVDLLEQASKLLPDDRFISTQLESAKKEKGVREQTDGLLRQAEAARIQGNYTVALGIADRAILLNPQDPRIRQVHSSLTRQAEEASQREKARKLVDEARGKLRMRRFQDAIDLLVKAEEFDPLQPDIQGLRAQAADGLAEEERRAAVEAIEAKVGLAVTHEEVEEALATVEQALNQFRNDPMLFRLQAQLTRQLREFEVRVLVEKTIQQCRAKLESSPSEALEIVQNALVQITADERLLALEAGIREHMARLERDRQRNAYLEQAHRALKNREYREAVRVLDACHGDLLTNEISELLRFAQREAQQQEQHDLLTATLAHANQLLREDDFDAAIAYIAPLVAEGNEPGLRTLLEQARSRKETVTKEAAAVLSHIHAWLEEGAYGQVIAFLDTVSPVIAHVPTVADSLRHAREARDREMHQLLLLGYAYASLDSRNPGVEWTRLNALGANDPGWLGNLQTALVTRRADVAAGALGKHAESLEQQLDLGEFGPAGRWIEAHVAVFPFLDASIRNQWEQLRERARLRKNPTQNQRVKSKGR
jgi:serine/threonine-protein kinase